MLLPQWLITFAVVHNLLIYALLVILACAEGPWLSLICGVLLRLGYLHFFPVYASLMAGDLLGDAIWYWIGRRYGLRFVARYGHRFSITEAGIEKVKTIFHRYKDSILFVSKVSNGFGFALVTLMTAGMTHVPFRRYMAINLAGQFIWSGLLIGVGYFFSQLYVQFDNILVRIGIVAVFIMLVAAFFGYRNYLRKKVEGLEL